MVYCTKCGTENLDDAETCANCGVSLRDRPFRTRRSDQDMCFGGRNRSMGPIIFGAIMILVGLSFLLERTFAWARIDNLWPLIIIGIGLLVVYNATQKQKNHY